MKEALLRTNIKRAFSILLTVGVIEFFMLLGVLLNRSTYLEKNLKQFYEAAYLSLLIICIIAALLCRHYMKKGPYSKREQFFLTLLIYLVSLIFLFWGVAVTVLDMLNGYQQLLAFTINFVVVGVLFIHSLGMWLLISLPPMTLLCILLFHFVPLKTFVGDMINLWILYICILVSVYISLSSFRRNEIYRRRIEQLYVTDHLTGLHNRDGLQQYLQRNLNGEWERKVGILFIDIDFFKQYNDFYGHSQGDKCLEKIGRLLRNLAKEKNAFAMRYGGEEFIFTAFDYEEEAFHQIALLIQSRVQEAQIPHENSSISDYLTVSIGEYYGSVKDRAAFMQEMDNADVAVYEAKKSSRNTIVPYKSKEPPEL